MSQDSTLSIRKGVSQSKDPATAALELHQAISQDDCTFALFYCSPDYDLEKLGSELRRRFEGVNLIGCTTAGEITPAGYLNGSLTGVSIASRNFSVVTTRLDGLHDFTFGGGTAAAQALIAAFPPPSEAQT